MIENHWVSVIAIDVQMFSCACFFPSTLLYISRPFRCSNSQFVISHIIQCFFLFLHITTLFILYGIPWYVVISWRQCNRKLNVVNCMRSARTHDGICCFNDINSFFVDFFFIGLQMNHFDKYCANISLQLLKDSLFAEMASRWITSQIAKINQPLLKCFHELTAIMLSTIGDCVYEEHFIGFHLNHSSVAIEQRQRTILVNRSITSNTNDRIWNMYERANIVIKRSKMNHFIHSVIYKGNQHVELTAKL